MNITVEYFTLEGRYESLEIEGEFDTWLDFIDYASTEASEATGLPKLYFLLHPFSIHTGFYIQNYINFKLDDTFNYNKDQYTTLHFGANDTKDTILYWIDELIIHLDNKEQLRLAKDIIEKLDVSKDIHKGLYHVSVLVTEFL